MTLKNYLRASEKTATKIIDKIDYQSRDTLKAKIGRASCRERV